MIIEKAKERGTLVYIEQSEKYLQDIKESTDLRALWKNYAQKYSYANDISYEELIGAVEFCIKGIEI